MIRYALRLMVCWIVLAVAAVGVGGCASAVNFPWQDIPDDAQRVGAFRAYDGDRGGRADFFLFVNEQGRVDRLGYGTADAGCVADASLEIVHLDDLDLRAARHVVIILDGIGYDVLREFYDQGHLRVFHPPSRVVSPYPSLTDLCLEDALNHIPAAGMEAKYFDRHANAMVGGSMNYLKGANQPYDDLLHYRANLIMDALGYLAPSRVFKHELNNAKKALDKTRNDSPEFLAYFVSSAGLGTALGQAGQIEALVNVERLVNQLLYETRGQIRLTMFADHGHTYTPGRRVPLEKHLAARGWNVVETLQGPRDVAYVRFGLITSASFSTDSPAELAADLVTMEGVELASFACDFPFGPVVVVYGPGGPGSNSAIIHRTDNDAYYYHALQGDPLNYLPILANVPRQEDGSYRDADLLAATADCEYPMALQRLWRAHFGLVEHPPDVIVSLANDVYSGSRWMAFFATVASTHGSLNRVNSTTFAMTTIAPLPPILQSRDLAPALERLLGERFPRQRQVTSDK